uniref:Uncharacterized protein n=1 Tax=Sus scrofa TaxID=9823 RepID=A0A8D0QRZ9_PIG
MYVEPEARLVLTLQTLSRALSTLKACWGRNVTFHMLGPFRKVPDRVTGAIFHALVQCVAPQGSQLYQNLNPICQLITGAFVFFFVFCFWFFFALFPQDLMAISLQAFSPSPELLGCCTQVPVSCLRSYCQPFRTPSQGKSLHSYGSCLLSPPSSFFSTFPSFSLLTSLIVSSPITHS